MGVFGAYGKMPGLGDFFRIDASPAFVDPWDRWLQTCLSEARQALSDRWQDCYMAAPIWRFSLEAGIAGPRPVAGVLMPSVDRVGRMFPLTLVGPMQRVSASVFGQLEEAALAALDDGITREGLKLALDEIAETAPATSPPSDTAWQAVLEDRTLEMSPGHHLPTGLDAVRLFDLSLWPDAPDLSRWVGS